ncbi:MAG TPA: glycosyltransferase family 9 protein [Pedobacter sp.]|nr:glycosyltransferase family 9 protein [Pedobacter sp.]
MAGKAKLLIIRFSAMGDVAMTAPVLKEFRAKYPDVELVVVSRALFKPFFNDIDNLSFEAIEPGGKHKGFFGLVRLFRQLKTHKITAVADLHNNLRSKVLTSLFMLTGISSATLNKGRSEKKQLTRKINKQLIPLKLTVQRYADVFAQLGYPIALKNTLQKTAAEALSGIGFEPELQNIIDSKHQNPIQKWIGLSPFAQHKQKVYPYHKLEEVILTLAGLGHQVFIFGGSEEEQRIAENWASKHINIISLVRTMKLEDELKFISNLDLMLSMDSSGMHLASLKNIPAISVWGATHPYAGFLGYGQSISDAVQTDLYCRPCSVYGNVPCYRGDFACMNNLSPQTVIDTVLNKLQ